MSKKEAEKGKVVGAIFRSAVQGGIETLLRNDPFLNKEAVLSDLNEEVIREAIGKIISSKKFYDIGDPQKMSQYLFGRVVELLYSGDAFIEGTIRERVSELGDKLKRSSGGFFKGYSARRDLNDLDYVNRTYLAAKGIVNQFPNGEMPEELAGAIGPVLRAGSGLMPAKILEHHHLISPKQYEKTENYIYRTIAEGGEEIPEAVLKYTEGAAQRTAAVILGGIGLIIVAGSGLGLTGNVIGNISNTSVGLFGGFLFFISLLLFLMREKK